MESTVWTGALSWWRIQSFGQSSSVFLYAQLHITASILPHYKLCWLFGLVEWIQSKQSPWYLRKWGALASIVISTFVLSWVMVILAVSITSSFAFRIILKVPCFIYSNNFTQNLMLIHCFKNWSLIPLMRRRNTHLTSATTSTQLALMGWNRNWCKLKQHRQVFLWSNHMAPFRSRNKNIPGNSQSHHVPWRRP